MKMNRIKLHKQVETMNKKQLICLCKSLIDINCELEDRIDKAIEYIRNNCISSNEWTDLDFCNFVPTGNIKYKQLTSKKVKDLLDILRGEE